MAIAGCGAAATEPPRPPVGPTVESPASRSVFADDQAERPAYGVPELQKAIAAERELVAAQTKQIAVLEGQASTDARSLDAQMAVAVSDLAVRQRFIATLEACEAAGRLCPPRLDDPSWTYDPERGGPPPLTAPLRFDRDDWRAVTAELHGRACACRTMACVESLTATIDQLEPRPMREVQGDEPATEAITAARACLFRLRGKIAISTAPPPADD